MMKRTETGGRRAVAARRASSSARSCEVRRRAAGWAPVSSPARVMEERIWGRVSRGSSSTRRPRRRSLEARPTGLGMTKTRVGRWARMRSKSGWVKVPILGLVRASGGKRQKVVTPAT